MAKHNFRELNRVEKKLIEQGFIVRRTRDQHLRVIHPVTKQTAMWSSAGHDARSNANSRAKLRAIGANVAVSN